MPPVADKLNRILGALRLRRLAGAVKKYAAEEADTGTILRNMHPRDFRAQHTDQLPLARAQASDFLRQLGREQEADLLADPKKHVYMNDQEEVADAGELSRRLHGHNGWREAIRWPDHRAYLDAALWSSMDEANDQGGEPLDENYGIHNIHPATLAAMIADIHNFRFLNAPQLAEGESEEADQGHDFWLNRNGHVTGFWDNPERYGDHANDLDEASHRFGEYDLDIGDDGMIHGSYEVPSNDPQHNLPQIADDPYRDDVPLDPLPPPDDMPPLGRYARAVKRYSRPEDMAALHAAIHAGGRDQLPHLAYADWLEQNGHSLKSKIIRYATDNSNDRYAFEIGPVNYHYPYAYDPEIEEVNRDPPPPGTFTVDWHNLASLHSHPQVVTLRQRSMAHPDLMMEWRMDVPRGEAYPLSEAVRNEGQVIETPNELPNPDDLRDQGLGPSDPNYTGGLGGAHYARAVRYAAYRAPAGGMTVRGTFYVGGRLVPDMQGDFVRGGEMPVKESAKKNFNPEAIKRIARALAISRARKVGHQPSASP